MWFDNTEEEASLLRDYGMITFFCLDVYILSTVGLVGIPIWLQKIVPSGSLAFF